MATPDDICPRSDRLPAGPTRPHTPPIYLSSVWECDSPEQADQILGGSEPGFVYAREGHPNAVMLAEKCRELHGTDQAAITGTGMAAMALVFLSQLNPGDHLVVSNQLYGRTAKLFTEDAARWNLSHTVVDATDLDQVREAMTDKTRLLIVETISNPLLRVADLAALAQIAHQHGAELLADNTFAGPMVCRPKQLGADWVMESLTKSMNGHSDVTLGLLCGSHARWKAVSTAQATWGLSAGAFECWLALRGLGTLGVRLERASQNALAVAQSLAATDKIESVNYPGLPQHPDHAIARRQFGEHSGAMVCFTLRGGLEAARSFIAAAQQIPFCPSLGTLATTLSHPASTSHRGLDATQRNALGITGGTIRLSVGIESASTIISDLQQALAAV